MKRPKQFSKPNRTTFFNHKLFKMKRLNLAAFKAQKTTQDHSTKVNQLLGQVLGNCHDGNSGSGGGGETEEIED